MDLGVKLMDCGKKLNLTEAGRLFLEKSDLLLKDYDFLSNTMTEFLKGEAGSIRLGVMEPTASYRLPLILAPFMQQYAKVQISIQIGNTTVLHQMLSDNEIDLAICTTPESGFCSAFEPLFVEQLGLLIPENHKLK